MPGTCIMRYVYSVQQGQLLSTVGEAETSLWCTAISPPPLINYFST